MRQSIILTLLLASIAYANTPKEIADIYLNFETKKLELLKAEFTRKDAKEKIVPVYEALEKALNDVKDIESKSKDDELTPEGNEMAYDLEILAPLKDLASGLMSKEDCDKARHIHSLNFPVVEDEDSVAIAKAIEKLCN